MSVPKPRPYNQLKADIAESIRSGKYMLGELIQPKVFKKYTISRNGDIKETEYTIEGRKIPLHEIRKNMYNDHKNLNILREDLEVVHRHLIVWADHASILSQGHLLLTVKSIYTPLIYYSDEEMLARTGIPVDVQKLVERPSLYIFGRTSDTTHDKLNYVETRLEDIRQIDIPMKIGDKTVIDTMRFFHGKKLHNVTVTRL